MHITEVLKMIKNLIEIINGFARSAGTYRDVMVGPHQFGADTQCIFQSTRKLSLPPTIHVVGLSPPCSDYLLQFPPIFFHTGAPAYVATN